MAITLSKGQKVSLTKGNPGLKHIVVGLGWDTNKYDGGFDFDLDSAAFLLDENGKVNADTDFVFYNNLKHSSGAVEHLGDNLTGEGDGDDEQIIVDLKDLPSDVDRIIFTVNIFRGRRKGQSFDKIENAFIRVVDDRDDTELVHYNLTENFKGMHSVVAGEIYLHNGEWRFAAIGEGFNTDDIDELASRFA